MTFTEAKIIKELGENIDVKVEIGMINGHFVVHYRDTETAQISKAYRDLHLYRMELCA